MLYYLLDQKVDLIWVIDCDEIYTEKDIYNIDWWLPIFKQTTFKDYLESKYSFRSQELDIATDIT